MLPVLLGMAYVATAVGSATYAALWGIEKAVTPPTPFQTRRKELHKSLETEFAKIDAFCKEYAEETAKKMMVSDDPNILITHEGNHWRATSAPLHKKMVLEALNSHLETLVGIHKAESLTFEEQRALVEDVFECRIKVIMTNTIENELDRIKRRAEIGILRITYNKELGAINKEEEEASKTNSLKLVKC